MNAKKSSNQVTFVQTCLESICNSLKKAMKFMFSNKVYVQLRLKYLWICIIWLEEMFFLTCEKIWFAFLTSLYSMHCEASFCISKSIRKTRYLYNNFFLHLCYLIIKLKIIFEHYWCTGTVQCISQKIWLNDLGMSR